MFQFKTILLISLLSFTSSFSNAKICRLVIDSVRAFIAERPYKAKVKKQAAPPRNLEDFERRKNLVISQLGFSGADAIAMQEFIKSNSALEAVEVFTYSADQLGDAIGQNVLKVKPADSKELIDLLGAITSSVQISSLWLIGEQRQQWAVNMIQKPNVLVTDVFKVAREAILNTEYADLRYLLREMNLYGLD